MLVFSPWFYQSVYYFIRVGLTSLVVNKIVSNIHVITQDTNFFNFRCNNLDTDKSPYSIRNVWETS